MDTAIRSARGKGTDAQFFEGADAKRGEVRTAAAPESFLGPGEGGRRVFVPIQLTGARTVRHNVRSNGRPVLRSPVQCSEGYMNLGNRGLPWQRSALLCLHSTALCLNGVRGGGGFRSVRRGQNSRR